MFNIASKEWGIEGLKNPIESMRMPKGSKPRDRRIETDGVPNLSSGLIEQKSEIELILETSQSNELRLFIKLALETAMRRSEIVQLKWTEIDLGNRTAYLPDTKPGESREVPLSSLAINTIKSIPKRTIKDKNGKETLGPKVFRSVANSISQAFARA